MWLSESGLQGCILAMGITQTTDQDICFERDLLPYLWNNASDEPNHIEGSLSLL
jgi:hypothetical protein